MPELYSHSGGYPAPLPFRITLKSGQYRTDPATFTKDELSEAGFIGPISKPTFNPKTESLVWDGNKLQVQPLTDAQLQYYIKPTPVLNER
jgi:hypothetical protein